MLNDLPHDVLGVIASYCEQADLVNLTATCSALSDAVLPAIYRCIVIDTDPRALYGGRARKFIYGEERKISIPVSSVHTIGGIKQVLETLGTQPHYASLVRSLSVRGNVAMSDNVLIPRVRKALQNLTGVVEFEWTACPELPPELLGELPQNEQQANEEIVALSVDLATRPGQCYPSLKFPSLRKLSVRPYLNVQVLDWLRDLVRDSEDIEVVRLNRFLDTKQQVGSSFTFVGLSDVHKEHCMCAPISVFFQPKTGTKYHLKCLDLVQIDTCVNDAAVLKQCIELTELEELKLVGSGRENEFGHGILAKIAEAQPQLRRVEIDWNVSVTGMQAFLSKCCRVTQMLVLTIKDCPRRILDCLKKECSMLTYLDLRICCDFSLNDLEPLKGMRKLEVLKLPFNYMVDSWELALDLPRLKVIELEWQSISGALSHSSEGSLRTSRRPINMGLLTSGIMDQWNDLERSPLQCARILDSLKLSESLQYAVLDGHTTPMRTEIPPLCAYMCGVPTY